MTYTLPAPCHHEITVKKSRFLACVQPMSNRSQAQLAVQQLRQQHPGAAHVCWALLAGGSSAAVDDGEPSGTAGRPMLEVLRHQQLENVLATVVRYFGGVKLGAGGLVRAYTDAVAQALLQATKIPQQTLCTLRCQVPYALEGWLRRELTLTQVPTPLVEHADGVTFTFQCPEHQQTQLMQRLNEGGRGVLLWLPT